MKLKPGFIFITVIIIFFSLFILKLTFPGKSPTDTTLSDNLLLSENQAGNYTPSPTISVYPDYIVITETPVPTRTPTPSLTPTPTMKIVTSSQFEEWFEKYSSSQSINKEILKKIAVCESGLNPRATNGIYGGLYQFSESSWRTARRQMNQDQNPELRFDAEEAIETATFRLATNGLAAWPNCSK